MTNEEQDVLNDYQRLQKGNAHQKATIILVVAWAMIAASFFTLL